MRPYRRHRYGLLNGGWAETISVGNGGLYLLSSGASTHDTRISGGGSARVGRDVMATGVTVLDGGVLHVNPAGYARAPVVSSGGAVYVSSAGIVDKAKIYGSVFISSGGSFNSSTVNSGGRVYVSSGATATKIVENGGYVDVKDGANVTFAPTLSPDLFFPRCPLQFIPARPRPKPQSTRAAGSKSSPAARQMTSQSIPAAWPRSPAG